MSYKEEKGNQFIDEWFDKSVLPSLSEFISIPNLSRAFDEEYKTNGLLERAGNHIKSWLQGLGLKGLKSQLLQPENLTPLLFSEIEGQIKDQTVVFYGHFDKQPWGTGWDENKGGNKPVIQNDKLYGRGGVDDGFSIYTSALAIRALQEQNIPLPRVIFLTEGDEQSGLHIEVYLERLKDLLGKIDLLFVLDSSVVDYDKFWLTKSLRGYMEFNIKLRILEDGVHSGDGSGIVPSTFKIANLLLSRLQNVQNGELIDYFQRNVPSERYAQFYENAKQIGLSQFCQVKKVAGLQNETDNILQTMLKRGWRPTLTVTGLTGFPPVATAGNLMLPEITIAVSIRLPPTFTEKNSEQHIKNILEKDTPFNCSVEIKKFQLGEGWNSSAYEPWFEEIVNESSKAVFGTKAYSLSAGASIPVVNCFAKAFPKANILVTGALGPNANAHGPNEFLHIPYAKKLAMIFASIVGRCSAHFQSDKK